MGQKISDALVRGFPKPASTMIVYDGGHKDAIRGFGLRTTKGGAKSFVLNYRSHGIERRLTIGRYPAWSVAAAREESKTLRRRIDRGEDPMAERHEEREAPTVGDLCRRYVEEHLPRKRPSSQSADRGLIAQWIEPELGRLKVAAVTHEHVCKLHAKITRAGTPIRANRTVMLLSKMFSLAVRPWALRADSPAKGVERNPENRRERFLSPAEIARLVEALKQHKNRTTADCLLLALLTGARIGECMSARWGQFDLQAGVWTKSAMSTKQAKIHRVPLSGPARQLLAAIRPEGAAADGFVFAGRKADEPLKWPHSVWRKTTKAAGIEGARIHDLRHTFASVLASSGSSLPVIGAMLGHTQATTTARYAHLLDDPLREAAERVGAIVTGGKVAEVVPLKRGG